MGTPGTAHLVDAYSGASILMANNWQPFVNGLCAAGGLVLSTERCSCLMHSWHREQPQPHSRCQGPECINCLTCSADGVHCFGGGGSGKLYLWEVPTGRLLVVWNGHFKPVTAVAAALSGGYLISTGEDAAILAWDLAMLLLPTPALVMGSSPAPSPWRTWTEHMLPASVLCIGGCGQHDLLASASTDQTVRLWRLADARRGCAGTMTLPSAITTLCIHPQHTAIYAGGIDGRVYGMTMLHSVIAQSAAAPHDCGAGSILLSASDSSSGPVRCVAVSPSGKRLYSISAELGVRMWDASYLSFLTEFMPTKQFDWLLMLPPAEPPNLSGGGACEVVSATAAPMEVSAFALGPLQKFVETPPQAADAALEPSGRAMRCVPCDLRVPGGLCVAKTAMIESCSSSCSFCGCEEQLTRAELPVLRVRTVCDYGRAGVMGGGCSASALLHVHVSRDESRELHAHMRELINLAAHAVGRALGAPPFTTAVI